MKKGKALFLGVCLISMVGLMGFTAYAVDKSGCFISSDGKTLKANANKFVFTHQIYASNQSTPVATKKTVTIAF